MNRRQASLYLTDLPHVESLRLRHNPAQARLIPAHVTLCREDEVSDWDAFHARLESLCPFQITLEFGNPIKDDNFVFLPIRSGIDDFHEFRRAVLLMEPRKHNPHVTIIHPRNGTCTNDIFAQIVASIPPIQFTFREVMLIEQENGGIWNLVARVGTPSEPDPADNRTNKTVNRSRRSRGF